MRNPINEQFGPRVRFLRERAKLSREALAAKLRCSVPTVTRVENSQRFPTVPRITAWADALGVEPHELLRFHSPLGCNEALVSPPSLPVVRATALRAGKRRPADARKRVEALLKATSRRLDLPKAWLREGREHFVVVADASGVALGILPGDHLVVEVGSDAAPGDTVLAVMDGDPALRRCADLGGETILVPAPGTDETARRLAETEILGVARHVIRLGETA